MCEVNMKVFFFSTVVVGVYRENWQAGFVWWKTTKPCSSKWVPARSRHHGELSCIMLGISLEK